MNYRPLWCGACVVLVFVSCREIPVLKASMTESFKLNQSFGRTLLEQAQGGVTSGAMPLEGMGQYSSISESSVSQDNVSQALRDSEMGQYILEQEKRPDKKRVVIDPVHDPLMAASTEVIQDPLKVLKAEANVIREEGGETVEEHLCEDAPDPFELSCVQNLNVNVKNPGYESHIVTVSISGYWDIHTQGAWAIWFPVVKLWNHAGVYNGIPTYCPKTFNYTWRAEIDPSQPSFPGSYAKHGFWAKATIEPDLSEMIKVAEGGTIQTKFLSSNAYTVVQNHADPSLVRLNGYKSPYLAECFFGPRQPRSDYGWGTITGYDTLRFQVSFKRKPEITEAWQSGCAALDALSNDEGKSPCDLIEEKCTQGPETRVIKGVSVHRDCWQKTRYYLCGSGLPGTCGEYRIRGCTQTNSECIKKVGEHCIRWKQTYRCKKTGLARKRTSIKGEEMPWCLDGNCYSPMWEANTDMLNAISKMAVLAQIQKDMKDLNVFTGRGLQCRRGCLDFQNCCGTERGWGLSMKFASCNDEEKLLAQKQKNGLCVFLGTYCAKKVLGVCVQKRSTSCCFESKIARLIQVAAHHQLGIPWGSPENPQCRGLTPEELSGLDLEKVDFSELYEEIIARYKAPQVIVPQKDTLSQTVKGVSRGEPVAAKEGL